MRASGTPGKSGGVAISTSIFHRKGDKSLDSWIPIPHGAINQITDLSC